MKAKVLAYIIEALLRALPADAAKELIDSLIDKVEDYVKESPNKVDDNVLPMLSWLRAVINVPDND